MRFWSSSKHFICLNHSLYLPILKRLFPYAPCGCRLDLLIASSNDFIADYCHQDWERQSPCIPSFHNWIYLCALSKRLCFFIFAHTVRARPYYSMPANWEYRWHWSFYQSSNQSFDKDCLRSNLAGHGIIGSSPDTSMGEYSQASTRHQRKIPLCESLGSQGFAFSAWTIVSYKILMRRSKRSHRLRMEQLRE